MIPFKGTDDFDFYVINVFIENKLGQFVFPKSELIKKEIVSTDKKDGKRGFRVYPNWVSVDNKQSEKPQRWQCEYLYEINADLSIDKIMKLYEKH